MKVLRAGNIEELETSYALRLIDQGEAVPAPETAEEPQKPKTAKNAPKTRTRTRQSK